MTDKKHTELFYKAEACQAPLGETGDYDSWIELVTPNFNLQCFDPNIELKEVQELADMLNALAGLTSEDIQELSEWIKSEAKHLVFDYVSKNRILQAENERLRAELKAGKAEAWDEGRRACSIVVDNEVIIPKNPYKHG